MFVALGRKQVVKRTVAAANSHGPLEEPVAIDSAVAAEMVGPELTGRMRAGGTE